MLKRINGKDDESGAEIRIADSSYPSPFVSGLEYSAPARGTWNIVHTGMLIPEAHQIFVCAAGCLRGVVLTAAEMNAQERFSTIAVRENNILDGDMEQLIIDGVADIIKKLPTKPPAILVYTSCVHHFIGCDLQMVYRKLREAYPDIAFTDCYMNPTMRKSGLTPDQLMRRQLYSLLKKRPINPKSINIIGNNLEIMNSSELVKVIIENGFILRQITSCNSYAEYQEMAESSINITTNPAAKAGGDALKNRLGQEHMYLPASFGYDEISAGLNRLCDSLKIERRSWVSEVKRCEKTLEAAGIIIGSTPIAIDYTVTTRPLGLARLLLDHGFNVERVYIDSISPEESRDYELLKKNFPDLKLYSTVHAKMRFISRSNEKKILAIGQKAAYFTGSNYFVNVVEGGGMYGFDGVCCMAKEMVEAFQNEKDAKKLIQIKGLGCGCCS